MSYLFGATPLPVGQSFVHWSPLYATSFSDDVFSLDYRSIFQRYRDEYDDAFAETCLQYEADLSLFESYIIPGTSIDRQIVVDEITLLSDISGERRWFEENDESLKRLLGDCYLREETDFDSLDSTCRTFALLCRCDVACCDALSLLASSKAEHASFLQKYGPDYVGICSDLGALISKIKWAQDFPLSSWLKASRSLGTSVVRSCEDRDFATRCGDLKVRIESALEDVEKTVAWFANLFEADSGVGGMPVSRLLDKLEACSENLEALEEILDYRKVRADCDVLGLGNSLQL